METNDCNINVKFPFRLMSVMIKVFKRMSWSSQVFSVLSVYMIHSVHQHPNHNRLHLYVFLETQRSDSPVWLTVVLQTSILKDEEENLCDDRSKTSSPLIDPSMGSCKDTQRHKAMQTFANRSMKILSLPGRTCEVQLSHFKLFESHQHGAGSLLQVSP